MNRTLTEEQMNDLIVMAFKVGYRIAEDDCRCARFRGLAPDVDLERDARAQIEVIMRQSSAAEAERMVNSLKVVSITHDRV